MLDLPNGNPAFDMDQLCDWVEASALVSDSPRLSQANVFDSLGDSQLFEKLEEARRHRGRRRNDDTDETSDDRLRRRVEDIWRSLRARKLLLGEGYPFDVQPTSILRRAATWRDSLCFTLLLFSDLGKQYVGVDVDFKAGSDFCRLFEKVVEASQRLLFRGTTVRFGYPFDSGWPTPPKERIARLATLFERDTENLKKKTHRRDKDLGLDVASRLALGDEGEGLLTILTQCATGDNWRSKSEPSLKEWRALIQWQAVVVRAIAFPWRRRPDRFAWRTALRLDAIVLDRMRLLSAGNPDSRLDAAVVGDIQGWCEARAAEFPRL